MNELTTSEEDFDLSLMKGFEVEYYLPEYHTYYDLLNPVGNILPQFIQPKIWNH